MAYASSDVISGACSVSGGMGVALCSASLSA